MNRPAALWLLMLSTLVLLGMTRPAPDGELVLSRFATPDPGAYFAIAEELIESEGTRRLGIETLALVVLLSHESDPSLAAGACVAIASVTDDAGVRDGLWSYAVELDPDRAPDRAWTVPASAARDDASRRAAEVLGWLRNNNPEATDPLRDDPQIRSRVLAEGMRLGHPADRVAAVLVKWERDLADDPCRGRMTVRVRESGVVRDRACPDPSHHHGVVPNADLAMMIGIEMSLLGAVPESWSAQAAVGLDNPVPVWDAERVARSFGVSAARPLRRSGRWSAP